MSVVRTLPYSEHFAHLNPHFYPPAFFSLLLPTFHPATTGNLALTLLDDTFFCGYTADSSSFPRCLLNFMKLPLTLNTVTMQFHNSTPQTVGDHFAKQEARRASKRRSPHGSDMEPCAKKQKFLHASMPPGLTQFQARPTPYLRPVTDKGPKSVDASLPPVPTPSQTPATTNLGPSISTSKRKKYDHRSNTPAQSHDMANHGPGTKKLELDRNSGSVAQSHDITDLGPAHKKQRLSFASLPPGRGRVTLSVEERERKEAELNRCVHKRWCKSYEPNPDLTNESILPDAMLLSGKFNDYEYMSSHSSNNHGHASGPQEAATYPFDGSSAANPRSQSPKVGAYCGPRQELQHLFHHSPAPNRYPQALSVSGEVSIHHSSTQGPISRDCSHVTAVLSPALGGKVNEACPNLINQASTMLSSLNSSLEGPSCTASIPNAKHTTTSASADQTVLVGSVCDMADETVAASSDSSTPSSLAVTSRETVPSASSSQTALINSIRDTRDDGADMSSNQIPLSSSDVKLKGDITSTSSDFISLVDSIRHAGDKTANVSSDQIGFSLDVNLGDNTTPTGSDQTTVIDSSHDTGDKIANASSDQIAPPSLDFSLRENTTPTISDHMNVIESTRDAGDVTVDASLDEVVPSSLDVSLRDGTTPASTSETPSVGPARSKGGRPRGRKPRELKPPKGRTRFQKNHPVKATVNMDVWENILLFCPLDFLLRARSISKTFRSVLKHDSLIWKKARVNQFGPEMPDPPLGLSEPQYADLVTGNGCHTRGCTSKKARKTYWALGKRLCIECFQKSFIPVSLEVDN